MQQQNVVPTSASGIKSTHTHVRLAYPVREAAQLLGVSVWTLRDLFYNGKIRAHRLGNKLLIPASEIDRLLAESEATYMPSISGIGTIAAQHNKQRAEERRRKAASSVAKKARTAAAS
jgi:excisionase family DNA binding protein